MRAAARADKPTILLVGCIGRAALQYLGNVAYIDRLHEAVTAMSDLAVDGPVVDMRAGFWQVLPASLPGRGRKVSLHKLTATCVRTPAWGLCGAVYGEHHPPEQDQWLARQGASELLSHAVPSGPGARSHLCGRRAEIPQAQR